MNNNRIYAMGTPLTEEQVAVAFAMCSRSPNPFDKSAQQVSEARAAEFNEKWVLGYGHSSVAEHAITHLAVENISRVCADHLEDGRLSSYTEKSSRYQIIPIDGWHLPTELQEQAINHNNFDTLNQYRETMHSLMVDYRKVLEGLATYRKDQTPRRQNESEDAWLRRRRQESLDDARSLLPAATLTNLGMTINARSLAYLISRMRSSPLDEDRKVAESMEQNGTDTFPSLLRHAEGTEALQKRQRLLPPEPSDRPLGARLLNHDPDAEMITAEALRFSGATPQGQDDATSIRTATADLGPHDQPQREFEIPEYLFEVTLDYGALRELRRHRMMTFLQRSLTALDGHDIPAAIAAADLADIFENAMTRTAQLHQRLLDEGMTYAAQYAICHAHRQTVRIKPNLRQLRNVARLRTQPKAHLGIRNPVHDMARQVKQVHPQLYASVLDAVVSPEAEPKKPVPARPGQPALDGI